MKASGVLENDLCRDAGADGRNASKQLEKVKVGKLKYQIAGREHKVDFSP